MHVHFYHKYHYVHFICIGTAFSKTALLVLLAHLNPWLGQTYKHKEHYLCFREKCLSFRKPSVTVLSFALQKSVHVWIVCTSIFSYGPKLASGLNLLLSLSKTTILQRFHILLLANLHDIYSAYQNELELTFDVLQMNYQSNALSCLSFSFPNRDDFMGMSLLTHSSIQSNRLNHS